MALIDINWNPSSRELKQFAGIWFPLACAMICWFVWRWTGSLAWTVGLASVLAVVAVVAFAIPEIARRIYVGWMIAAFPIGWTVSHILMGIIYYGLITPMGLIMRLCGRDSMGRKFDKSRSSYWEPHSEPRSQQQYFRQY